MRNRKALGILLVIASTLPLSASQPNFRFERLGDKAAIIHIGHDCGAVVLVSNRGLVLVDTGVVPSHGAPLREAIEKEFGRKDFTFVINTHAHIDHTGGNQAFADIPIVAHQNAARELDRWYGTQPAREAFVQRRKEYRSGLEADLKKAADGSPDRERLQVQIADETAIIDDVRAGRFVPALPTIAFNDRMTLALGDLTLELVYFGRDHTSSDIMIHVPELELLLVGDLFMSAYIPMFQSPTMDISRNFQALDALPSEPQAVKTVVDGHAGRMTGDSFRARVAYLKDVWDGVTSARREGATLAATEERLRYDGRYPALEGLIRVEDGVDFHRENIEIAWGLQSESTARVLESLIAARGLEAAISEYRKTIAGNERYAADENAMIALGYDFLRRGRPAEAVAAFQLNVEAHPESWNAWDSLAEGHLYIDAPDKAEEYYAKSLQLNPNNENGKRQLAEIQAGKRARAAETREPARFSPGTKTGLKNPYYGLTPPGKKPEVFAPGIVSTAASMEFGLAFSPDGREIHFTRRKDGGENTIQVSRLQSDGWTAPEEAAFSKGYPSSEPGITPDGRRLYFNSNRPRSGSDRPEYAIWVVERTADGSWGAPRYHGPGMCVTAARNGNLYMTDVTSLVGADRPVIVYPRTGDGFGPPRRVGGGVNAPVNADHAFIAPDESYILFDSTRPGGQGGEGDLYVCFRTPDGVWGEAINLGNVVNTPATDFVPSVSPDGRYIFYSTNRDIYWVSAGILDAFRPGRRPERPRLRQ